MAVQNMGISTRNLLTSAAVMTLLAGCAAPQKGTPVSAVSELHNASTQLDRFIDVLNVMDQHSQAKGKSTDSSDKMKKLIGQFQTEVSTMNQANTTTEVVDKLSASAHQLDNADAMLFARLLKLFSN